MPYFIPVNIVYISVQEEELTLNIRVVSSDTTSSALRTFVLAMLHSPEVQKRAQRELDAVTAGHRLPEFADRASLPYIDAVVKEVLRWHPVTPFGLPHVSRIDDVGIGSFERFCSVP